jgi:chitinase
VCCVESARRNAGNGHGGTPSGTLGRSKTSIAAAGLFVLAAHALAAPAFVHGPYQDVSQGLATSGPDALRIARMPWEDGAARARTLSWAFAIGDCGAERWGDFDTAAFAARNVAEFSRAAMPYVIATGGEAGAFTCSSADALGRFVARYDSPELVGIDFDIERRQTPRQIAELVRAAAAVARARPDLRFSFTLATFAASDGSLRSLNATGAAVVAAIAAEHFDRAVINLMVMNYGRPDAHHCVAARAGDRARCDMGRSALQAARNVHAKYHVPYDRMALTAMIGENDVAANVFRIEDARVLVRGVRDLGLAGLHYWSLGRDRPCGPERPRVAPDCHGLPGVAAGAFGAQFDGTPR